MGASLELDSTRIVRIVVDLQIVDDGRPRLFLHTGLPEMDLTVPPRLYGDSIRNDVS
jgi:hypothetical protein